MPRVIYNGRMSRMRLMTLNIAHARGLAVCQGFQSAERILRNLSRIRGVLASSGADVVALQEVDQRSFWNHNVDCLTVLGAARQFGHAFMGINNYRPAPANLSYGNGLLSRHPIAERINRPFHGRHSDGGLRRIGGKGFQYAEIDVGGLILPVINLHLDFRSRRQRVWQVDQVIRFLTHKRGQHTASPVVCGDFNCAASRRDDAVGRLLQWLNEREPYHLVPDTRPTFPARFPARVLDHVLIPRRFRLLSAEVLPVTVSDHRPVLVEFDVREAA